MISEFRKIFVFISRDFKILFSYKLAFSMSFLSIIFTLFYLVLFGSMFGSMEISALIPYGGDFVSYILVGSIGWGFLISIMGATSTAVKSEMRIGTLESILLTPTKIFTMILSYALFGSFFGLITIISLVAVGYFLFGVVAFASASLFTVLIFVLSMITMTGFGLIFAGLTIWLKNIGGTVGIFQSVAMFFCGVYFPITVIPEILRPIHKIIPFYYSIEGIRKSLIPTTPASELWFYIEMLVIFSFIFIIVGLIVLRLGLKKAKKDGSLMFY